MGREIGVGLIGTGFMGECHGLAYAAVGATFEPPVRPRPEMVADIGLAAAERAATRFGFARATDDWRKLVTDPAVGLVAVASPNALHKEMALAAIAAGKHVYCEKPLALNAADAREMADAAARAGVVTLCGYNYLRSPAMQYAKRLIDEGVLGELTDVRFLFDEEYMADPAVPFSWRCRKATAGTGALGDMGSHVLSLARFLAGPITEVMTEFRTVIAKRPMPAGDGSREERAGPVAVDWSRMAEVENEDIVHALLRFRNGAVGHFGSSRLAWGRRNGIDIELYGSKGSIRFTQERFNEIDLFLPDADRGSNGFRTILTGPEHPPYGRFSPAGGHGLGFNDLKVAEVAHLMAAIAGEVAPYPDFAEGAAIEEVCDAMVESAASGRWVKVPA